MPTRPPTFDHLAKKKPLERTVRVLLDDGPVEALNEAQAALDQARTAGEDIAGAEESVAKARAAVESASVPCTFRSIGRVRYDQMVRAHPPTDEENDEYQAENGVKAPYSADSFSAALIAASCISPVMTLQQVETIRDEWNAAEYVPLFVAALEVNTHRRVADLGKDFG